MPEEPNKEKNIDIKGTLAKFVVADEPEMTQEEAIIKYEENKPKKKKTSTEDNAETASEEEEHLKRIKKELLASLERVNELARKLYGERAKEIKIKQLKVNKGQQGTSVKKDLNEQEVKKDASKNKERE